MINDRYTLVTAEFLNSSISYTYEMNKWRIQEFQNPEGERGPGAVEYLGFGRDLYYLVNRSLGFGNCFLLHIYTVNFYS